MYDDYSINAKSFEIMCYPSAVTASGCLMVRFFRIMIALQSLYHGGGIKGTLMAKP